MQTKRVRPFKCQFILLTYFYILYSNYKINLKSVLKHCAFVCMVNTIVVYLPCSFNSTHTSSGTFSPVEPFSSVVKPSSVEYFKQLPIVDQCRRECSVCLDLLLVTSNWIVARLI